MTGKEHIIFLERKANVVCCKIRVINAKQNRHMLSDISIFLSSRYLDDVSLHHLINALCSLSLEAMEMAYGNNKVNGFSR